MAKKFLIDLDFNGVARATNLLDPTSAQDAATKAYVDSVVEGLAWKDSARVATQANINLASPGATVDGVTMSAGDRVLVRAQTTASENGVYIWNGAAVAMSRSTDASTAAELEAAVLTVEEGTSAGTTYRQTAVNFTLGSGSVSWSTFGTASPDASTSTKGLIQIATQGEADAGTDALKAITPATLAGYANRKLKYAADIGDGSATQFTVTHNFGTRDVVVAVARNSSPWDEVLVDVERTTTNSVTVRFASAPTSNQFRVTVIG